MGDKGRSVVRCTRGRWRAIMLRIERNGQSRRECCEAEGLVLCTFSWWRRELGRSGPDDSAQFVELANGRPSAPAWLRASTPIWGLLCRIPSRT